MCPFSFLRDHRSKFLKNNIFLSLKIDFISGNNADPNEMPHYHLGLHCLPNNEKGLTNTYTVKPCILEFRFVKILADSKYI